MTKWDRVKPRFYSSRESSVFWRKTFPLRHSLRFQFPIPPSAIFDFQNDGNLIILADFGKIYRLSYDKHLFSTTCINLNVLSRFNIEETEKKWECLHVHGVFMRSSTSDGKRANENNNKTYKQELCQDIWRKSLWISGVYSAWCFTLFVCRAKAHWLISVRFTK